MQSQEKASIAAVLFMSYLFNLFGLSFAFAPELRHLPIKKPTFTKLNVRLFSSVPKTSSTFEAKRAKILNRPNGEHFELDVLDGSIEFGSTATLVTTLESSPRAAPVIENWLSKEQLVAASIWDEKLMQRLGDNVYRLELMTLQFVTISLAPRVDVLMWTEKSTASKYDGSYASIFKIESISFDPNIKILPGIGLTASSLGIQIEVAGELGLSEDGKGLSGAVGFTSRGILPAFMRILPRSILRGAVDLINRKVVNFAVQCFQKGAATEYGQYRKKIMAEYERQRQQQQE